MNSLRKGSRIQTDKKRSGIKGVLSRLAAVILKIAVLITAPFILLIRGAVFIHEKWGTLPWISILGGVMLTSILLFIYTVWLSGRLTGKLGSGKGMLRRLGVVACVVVAYCVHGIFALSDSHLKNETVRREYKRLHPILRLAIGTIVRMDEKFVVTDAARAAGDYKKMKLKTNRKSLHYVQSDGYVHAVDIRVNNRFFARNLLVRLYFQSMGFNTLRHVGTADHLHVSLFSSGNPGKI